MIWEHSLCFTRRRKISHVTTKELATILLDIHNGFDICIDIAEEELGLRSSLRVYTMNFASWLNLDTAQ